MQVERLIGRKPPPSRKRSTKRGPKHDNRRRRMKVDDPDLDPFDPDLSMSQKRRLSAIASAVFRASYGSLSPEEMTSRIATYHGIVQQGHPDGPYRGWRSHDRRYFGKEHYDSIVASAKSLLKEDWLKYGWEGACPGAPFRAALDLAIHTADEGLYQAKIDVETYNMLLARLEGDKTDQFSDTLLPKREASNRSPSAMSHQYQDLLRTASELRQTNPRAALEICKSVRALESRTASSKLDLKAMEAHVKKLAGAKDMTEYLTAVKGLSDAVKESGSRSAMDIPGLEQLEDMSEEEAKSFLDAQKKGSEELAKSIQSDDIEGFMKGLEDLFKEVGEASHGLKTASVPVRIADLVRVAASSQEARALLMPYLAAAKKKNDKAKGKKVSQKKSEEPEKPAKGKKSEEPEKPSKKPPFGGKKAPPFGKGKSKKASLEIGQSDLDW